MIYIVIYSLPLNNMPKLQLRFQKFDQFNNAIFIASKVKEPESFEALRACYSKLLELGTDTFLPVYADDVLGFATVRFKNVKTMTVKPQATYDVRYTIRQIEKKIRKFINCFVDGLRMVKEAPPVDLGVVLEF